jgi:GTP-binding protein EngB required for normal cell division
MPSPRSNIRTRSGISKQSARCRLKVSACPECTPLRWGPPYHGVPAGAFSPNGAHVFPPNHQRYLFSRFHYLDETLGEAVQALEPTDDGRLFKPLIPDATAAQRKILADYLAQLRFALRNFIEAQQLQEIPQPVSGLWSVRTAVIFAQNAVTELRPAYMRGYGALDADAVAASERLGAELTTLLKRIGDYLDKGEHGDLAGRLMQLDSTQEEIPLLRELERIITKHGLVELRAPLESLIERAAAPRYEIAVFGRVNSGKSSLLNWWLGQAVLPTGVIPVTAVPTRIVHGDAARAQVRVASRPIVDIPLDQLPSYVTEAGNPGNAKRVLEVVVEIPSERLSPGISLVDTPGLGFVASAGATQTLEYLPHCDLGIQLIEAAGAVTREDIAVARAILDGGSDVVIALSKADRLSNAELAQAKTYVGDALGAALGVTVSVRPISTLQPHCAVASEWFEAEVAPRLASYRERAAALLKRKVGVLRETIIAVLSARLDSGSNRTVPPPDGNTDSAGEPFSQMRADLERARADVLVTTDRARDCTAWLAGGVAKDLAARWLNEPLEEPSAVELVRAAMARRTAEIGDLVGEGLKDCYSKLRQLLARSAADPQPAVELPQPRGRPIFDVAAIPALVSHGPPRWAFGLRPLLLAVARDRINTQMGRALSVQLSVYSAALRLWGERYLDDLVQLFENALAARQGMHRSRAGVALEEGAAGAMRRDLQLLQHWPAARAAQAAVVSPAHDGAE